ncbi:hypothetical protein, partial [Ciceribacter sp. RN22]|uniref:hypothetical protein n=1 Tax=Ciceribacter sp. RN22 TaxID=2954932 RepID=UPI002092F9A3
SNHQPAGRKLTLIRPYQMSRGRLSYTTRWDTISRSAFASATSCLESASRAASSAFISTVGWTTAEAGLCLQFCKSENLRA